MSETAREHLLAYIAAHNTLTLATEHNGKPFAASLFYASDEFALYFVSDPKTRHADNLKSNVLIAATISEDYQDWRVIQGVQIEGVCKEIANENESVKAMQVYARKFPFVGELGAAMAKIKFYKIEPTWVRFIDNTRGFGFKEEINLEAQFDNEST